MNKTSCLAALQERAAWLLQLARLCERSSIESRVVSDVAADLADNVAVGHRTDAGVCIAAINHLNGVSPE